MLFNLANRLLCCLSGTVVSTLTLSYETIFPLPFEWVNFCELMIALSHTSSPGITRANESYSARQQAFASRHRTMPSGLTAQEWWDGGMECERARGGGSLDPKGKERKAYPPWSAPSRSWWWWLWLVLSASWKEALGGVLPHSPRYGEPWAAPSGGSGCGGRCRGLLRSARRDELRSGTSGSSSLMRRCSMLLSGKLPLRFSALIWSQMSLRAESRASNTDAVHFTFSVCFFGVEFFFLRKGTGLTRKASLERPGSSSGLLGSSALSCLALSCFSMVVKRV